MSYLTKPIVLKLNASWRAIEVVTPEQAFGDMVPKPKGRKMEYPYFALHIELPDTYIPVKWDDWIELPVRSNDRFVRTAHREIRIPTVIIANNYRHIPKHNSSYSKFSIWTRDNYTCQISGEKVSHKTGSIDHWVPQSKGGLSTFENCLLLTKKLNQLKGDMTMEAFCKKYGYKVPKKPQAPGRRVIYNNYGISDWDLFLEN